MKRRVKAQANLGPKLRRRMIEGWARFEHALLTFSARLAEMKHTSRSCDQLGTLLAGAWALLRDGDPTEEDLVSWTEDLAPEELAATSGEETDAMRLLIQVFTSRDPTWRSGEQRLIGEVVRGALGQGFSDGTWRAGKALDKSSSRRDLTRMGMKIEEIDGQAYLAVSNTHHSLQKLLEETPWKMEAGSDSVWAQSLARIPGALRPKKAFRFEGSPTKAVLVPIDALPIDSGEEE
jgi:hypothetical protein